MARHGVAHDASDVDEDVRTSAMVAGLRMSDAANVLVAERSCRTP